ncbi:MAG: DUF997 family protein [Rubrobacteraceae bacterium]
MEQDREVFFEEDRRYRQCNKEAVVTFAFFFVNFVLIGVVALVLGYNKPAEEVQFILGFPAWFFWGAVVGTILECILGIMVVVFFFREMSIQPEDEEESR